MFGIFGLILFVVFTIIVVRLFKGNKVRHMQQRETDLQLKKDGKWKTFRKSKKSKGKDKK